MPTLQLRPMTLADCQLLGRVFAELPGNLDPRAELARELTRSWVACDESGPLGFALAWWVVDELELLALATLPEARRRGVARRLLDELCAWARRAGAHRVTLEVASGNSAARALYENAGFATFNVRRGYYRANGDDALEMELVF
ncbi:MAG TPA: GNAT family N-acetyltransferase [Polyangiaceae bacterium]|nr:GNAT family N-acetyltransferase [Polyangiaceae bacterium]